MIATREKNQRMVQDAINEFASMGVGSVDEAIRLHTRAILTRYTKFLAQRMLARAEDNDCYVIDMLEDIERMGGS